MDNSCVCIWAHEYFWGFHWLPPISPASNTGALPLLHKRAVQMDRCAVQLKWYSFSLWDKKVDEEWVSKNECERCREQTSSYQWGKDRAGTHRGRGGKSGILWDYMKSCVELLEIVKHYRIKRIFHSIKKKNKTQLKTEWFHYADSKP